MQRRGKKEREREREGERERARERRERRRGREDTHASEQSWVRDWGGGGGGGGELDCEWPQGAKTGTNNRSTGSSQAKCGFMDSPRDTQLSNRLLRLIMSLLLRRALVCKPFQHHWPATAQPPAQLQSSVCQ